MINLIETFREVIEAGIYPQEPYMCVALDRAAYAEVVSQERAVAAEEAIRGYIGSGVSTRAFLSSRGDLAAYCSTGEWASKFGVDFYLNWAARPYIGTRSVQDTFKAVIEAGIYPTADYFMCNALDVAWIRGVITEEEMHLAAEAIDAYIAPAVTVTMVSAVTQYTTPDKAPVHAEVWADKHGVEFYTSWDTRPAIANLDGDDDAYS